MAEVFFRASNDAMKSITYAYDFVHPVTVSMKYLRKEIEKLKLLHGTITNDEIKAIIDPDSMVHGVNYERSFVQETVEEQEERIAWLLLNNLFAIHEGWAQRLYTETFADYGYTEKLFIKNLEFSDLSDKIFTYFIPSSKKSTQMEGAFFEVYKQKSGLDFNKLDNYMLCYRYFKEARNCFMHGNFIASQKVLTAYNNYISIATMEDLDVSEVPITIAPILNERINLCLRGVIGFSLIVLRIIRICDAYLICAKAAEKEFLDRKPEDWKTHTLSGTPAKAMEQISSYSMKAGFIRAKWTQDYQNYLLDKNIFTL